MECKECEKNKMNECLIGAAERHNEEMEKVIQCRETDAYNEGFRDGQKVTVEYWQKEVKKLQCCGNCKNEKFLSRTYEITVCNECVEKSNWSKAE